ATSCSHGHATPTSRKWPRTSAACSRLHASVERSAGVKWRVPRSSVPMTALALAENRLRQFLALAKPRVVSLIVFCAVIGMFLATPGFPPAGIVIAATVGIALVAG